MEDLDSRTGPNSPADVFFDGSLVRLRARAPQALRLSLFPNVRPKLIKSSPLRAQGRDGVFWSYSVKVQPQSVAPEWTKVREGIPSQPVSKGEHNALAPADAQFDQAASWRVHVPVNRLASLSDSFLRVEYTGDVARLYCDSQLLADDFFKGTIWEIGLKRFLANCHSDLLLKITPLRKDAPVYIPHSAWPSFPPSSEIAKVNNIRLSPEYELVVDLQGTRH